MTKAQKFTTREEWLTFVSDQLRPTFKKVSAPIPAKVRFSLGFTSAGYRSKAIGECHSPIGSGDGNVEIFIKSDQDDAVKVAGILAHELVHAAVGVKEGHKGKFRSTCKALGFEGPMRSTLPGTDMQRDVMDPILKRAGKLPHKKLTTYTTGKKKQTTRLLKAECAECGYVVRLSAKWAEVGTPFCGASKSHGRLVCEDIEEDEGGE